MLTLTYILTVYADPLPISIAMTMGLLWELSVECSMIYAAIGYQMVTTWRRS